MREQGDLLLLEEECKLVIDSCIMSVVVFSFSLNGVIVSIKYTLGL